MQRDMQMDDSSIAERALKQRSTSALMQSINETVYFMQAHTRGQLAFL